MAIINDPSERLRYYCDTALDVIINQIKNGTIRCGSNASKLKYGVPPKEVKGWWLTNDKHRPKEEKETPEPERSGESESDDNSKPRESKQDIVYLLRELDKRRDSRKHHD